MNRPRPAWSVRALLPLLPLVSLASAAAFESDRSEPGQLGSFTVGTITAQPGERAAGFLPVPPGPDGSTQIPISILHGSRPGPVLALVAGTHGYEYAPIVALQRLAARLAPREISGTVIVVHIANLPSFLGRTIYYSPIDGKNLNRVYPGRADGTLSERIAYVITREVIEQADYLVDLHCGDGNEALRPYTYWMKSGNAAVDEGSKQMALAFGLDHIVIDTDRPSDPARSVYCANAAITRGKPAITTETGQLGRTDPKWVARVERGVTSLLRHLRMLAGKPDRVTHPIWIDRSEVLRSSATGIFYPAVEPGETVARGTLIGTFTDFFGNKQAEVRAPFAGVVLYVVATPPVSAGEPLAMVGHIQREGTEPRGSSLGDYLFRNPPGRSLGAQVV
ncbi:MAG: succinylglutamate desuccinylase/aspartoacylase family protein, partial [Terriglobia bacterium]